VDRVAVDRVYVTLWNGSAGDVAPIFSVAYLFMIVKNAVPYEWPCSNNMLSGC
jgi:hypothetical protein